MSGKRHKLVWNERLRWSVRCSCSWGHLSGSQEIAEEAVARHLAEAARIADLIAARTTGQLALEVGR